MILISTRPKRHLFGSFVYHTLGVRNFNILNLNPSSLGSSSEILHLEVINSAEWVKITMNLKLQSALCHHVWQFSVRISMPSRIKGQFA